MAEAIKKRLTFIDVARTYAIFLVLLSHALNSAGAYGYLGEFKQFFKVAPPMFIFMFGFMVEFVYVRKVQETGMEPVKNRLLVRSAQCYAAYSLTSLSAVIGGLMSFNDSLLSLVFLSNSRYGNILRVYAVILVFIPLLINLRLRFGAKSILASLASVIVSFPLLEKLEHTDLGVLNRPLNIFWGIGPVHGGPSIWHSLSFVLAGMYVASGVSGRQSARRFFSTSLIVLAVSFVLGQAVMHESLFGGWSKFVDGTYRSENAAGYYILGIVCSVASIVAFYITIGSMALPSRLKPLMAIGYSSLLAYTGGNILLNLSVQVVRVLHPLLFVLLFMCCVILFSAVHVRLPFYRQLSSIFNFKGSPILRLASRCLPPWSYQIRTEVPTVYRRLRLASRR